MKCPLYQVSIIPVTAYTSNRLPRVNNVAENEEKPEEKAEPEYEDAHVGAVANLSPYHHLNW